MTDDELLLEDRLAVIRAANEKYDLEHNAYLSFSGGKDSTVVHYLLDKALPGNNIPRVFLNTGIEYQAIRDFVMKTAQNDHRFVIVLSGKPIKAILEEYGYPFKRKEHSKALAQYQFSGFLSYVRQYLGLEGDKLVTCPASLRYQFSEDFRLKVSDKCCLKLKKELAHRYQRKSGRSITITGMMREEGGQRRSIKGCVITDRDGNVTKFHPILVCSSEWEDWFIRKEGIELCELYGPPYNFKRTGCKGCPFALDLQEQLSIMEVYLPNERKQCEAIWKPVYDEYRRIGYRLKKDEQLKLL